MTLYCVQDRNFTCCAPLHGDGPSLACGLWAGGGKQEEEAKKKKKKQNAASAKNQAGSERKGWAPGK